MIDFDFELNYFDEVEKDIDDAKLWYYEQNPDSNLEERFAKAIKEIILKIQKNPFIYYPILKIFELHILKSFPTEFIFTLKEDIRQITIVAILHNKQDRRKLKRRI